MKYNPVQGLVRHITSVWFAWTALAVSLVVWKLTPSLLGESGEPGGVFLGLSLPESVAFSLMSLALSLQLLAFLCARVIDLFSPKGIVYNAVKYHWNFSRDGSFSGVCIYCVQNRGGKEVGTLPAESLVWFRNPAERDIKFRLVLRDGIKTHSLSDDGLVVDKSETLEVGLKFPTEHSVRWVPKIFPALGRGEVVEYEAEIETERTELDAFTVSGSTLGFPVHHRTGKVDLVARAPAGYRFELLEPSRSLRRIGAVGQFYPAELAPEPVVEGDGSVLVWAVANPIEGARYIASYRFTKK